MIKIYLDNATCPALDYQHTITVEGYKVDNKLETSAIVITYKNKKLVLPLSHIICIEII
jgi:hypothetical protein